MKNKKYILLDLLARISCILALVSSLICFVIVATVYIKIFGGV
jgi:hypothetical protein